MTNLEINNIINYYYNQNIEIKDIKFLHDYDKNQKIISFSYKKQDDLKEGIISMPYSEMLNLLTKEMSYE